MRSGIADARTAPVENLATNPSFNRAAAGSTTVRRNLCANPVAGATNTGWATFAGTGGTATGTRVTGLLALGFPVDTGYQSTWSVGATAMGGATYWVATDALAGRTYTLSAYVAPSVAQRLRILVEFRDSGGGVIGTSLGGVSTDFAAGQAQRLAVTGQAPIGAVSARLLISPASGGNGQPWPTGASCTITAAMIEERPALLPFFYGGTIDNTSIAYSWEGAANASASIARASVVEVRRNLCQRPVGVAAVDISGYSGANGAVVTWDSGLLVDVAGGTATDSGLNLTVGTAIPDPGVGLATISMDVTGVVADEWRISAQGPWVNNVNQSGAYVAVGVGETKRISFTIDVKAASVVRALYLLRRTMGSSGRVRVRNVLFEVGGVAHPFFDGDATPDADLTPAWTGTANASPSVLYGTKVGVATSESQQSIFTSGRGTTMRSLRALRTGTASNNWAVFAQNLPNIPGRTYTILVRLYSNEAVSNVGISLDRSGYSGITFTNGPLNGSRAARLVYVGNDAAAGVNARMALVTPPADVGKSVWIEQFAVIEGNYTGPYIDGDMPGCIWRGAPHASVSVGYPVLT